MIKNPENILKLLCSAIALAVLPACAATETVLNGHPESIAEENDIYYVACIGEKLTPTEKDGDGFIATLNRRGKLISPNAFPNVKLDAPKGAVIEDGILYVADVDRVVGINLNLGTAVQIIDLSKEGTSFLNDIVEDDGFLYVSATDISKLFRINLGNGSYEEFKTAEALNGPNGLALEDGVLYIAEYGANADGTPIGKIKAVSLKGSSPRAVSVVHAVPGLYDGIAIESEEDLFGNETDYLYFSDWAMNGKPGAVKKLNLKTRTIENATVIPVNGPADFIVEDGKLWIPAMVDRKIVID